MSDLIRPAVRKAFFAFNAKHEAVAYCCYSDIKGLVTTGVGNLIDPLDRALPLPWKRPDGQAASPAEVTAEWQRIKTSPGAASGGLPWAIKRTALRLSQEDVKTLVDSRLDSNGAFLAKRWPAFPQWPADAQLAVLSWAWAVGAGREDFDLLEDALAAGEFREAAEHVWISEKGNPGVHKRNLDNTALLRAASAVVESGGDPSQLTAAITLSSGLPPVPPPGELSGWPGSSGPATGGSSGPARGDGAAGAGWLALGLLGLWALLRRGRH